jgi:predicted amidophosphoribosyltransferase
LIDDVLTTGSTAHGCAHVLQKAKPATIAVLTVVRA